MAGKQIDLLAAGIVDSSGNPLQSGTAELFEAGTNNPVTGYADSALTSSLGSTITLDSRGAKLVFVDGLVDLKIVIKDSDDVTINTYDGLDYTASSASIITDDPEFLLQNTDQEDTDGGRQSTIRFRGEQSGGEASTLATIIASHEGSADDQKGRIAFSVNDGDDDETPTVQVIMRPTNTTFDQPISVSSGNSGFGVTTASAFGNVHIRSAASGAGSVAAAADELTIEGSGQSGMTILSGTSDTGNIFFGDSANTAVAQIVYNHSSNIFDFVGNGITAIRIDSTGQVGINNASPSESLDVTGNIAVSGTVDGIDVNAHANDSTIHFTVGSIDHGSITGLGDDDHTQYSLVDGTRAFTGGVTVNTGGLSITGNSGFGVTAASAFGSLHVRTSSSGASGVAFGADELILENSGQSGMTILSGTSNTGSIFFGDSANTAVAQISYSHATNVFDFVGNGITAIRIDAAGQVGINNSSPGESLDVTGNIAVSGTVDGIDVNAHATDTTIHFTKSSISYLDLSDTPGSFTAQNYPRVNAGGTAIEFLSQTAVATDIQSSIDHGSVAGLADDDHTQYVLANGTRDITGSQTIVTASSGVTPNANADELFIEGSGNAGMTIGSGTSSNGNIFFGDSGAADIGRIEYEHSGNRMRLYANSTDILNITSTDAQSTVDFNPGVTESLDLGSASLEWDNLFVQNSPTVSDERRKNSIQDISYATTLLNNLRPVQFKYNDTQVAATEEREAKTISHTRPHTGFIAQEVKQAMTDAGLEDWAGYAYDSDEDLHMLRLNEFISVLVAGFKEIEARVKQLETA